MGKNKKTTTKIDPETQKILDEAEGKVTTEKKERKKAVIDEAGYQQMGLLKVKRENYVSNGKSLDNDDDVAQKLRGMELDEVYKLCATAERTTVKELSEKYGHLNKGMQRMNLGNRIRRAARDVVKAAAAEKASAAKAAAKVLDPNAKAAKKAKTKK